MGALITISVDVISNDLQTAQFVGCLNAQLTPVRLLENNQNGANMSNTSFGGSTNMRLKLLVFHNQLQVVFKLTSKTTHTDDHIFSYHCLRVNWVNLSVCVCERNSVKFFINIV